MRRDIEMQEAPKNRMWAKVYSLHPLHSQKLKIVLSVIFATIQAA
jgi:hypothetical protein